jgi:hypothetical protein
MSPAPKNQTQAGMPLDGRSAAVSIITNVVRANPATDRIVVTQYPRFRMFIGFSSSRPRTKNIATMVASSPKARTTSGKKIQASGFGHPRSTAIRQTATPRIMAPMFSAAVDSKRSAPRPAQSPTLSPTRSATTAALRGSSSGMPASTLPTRSAPTSAAFV